MWPKLTDRLEHLYDSRWFVIPGKHLRAGDDVTVTLHVGRVERDYTLLGYTDIRAVAEALLAQFQLPDNRLLDADDMDSDDMDSDDMDSDDMDSDDMDSDEMDSDDMDSDDMDSDDMDSDDMDSDDMDSGEPLQPDVDKFRDVYASAQRHALRSASVTPGPADEEIHTIARAGGADLYFRVRGHLGDFDADEDFTISASVVHREVCPKEIPSPRWSRLPARLRSANKSTLILTRSTAGSLAAGRDVLGSALAKLEDATDGVVHDLSSDAALERLYGAWLRKWRECVPVANAIVDSVRGIVKEFAAENPLRYVVIVGGDDVVPFARVEDRAKISREWRWQGPYEPGSPLGASLIYGYYLSDGPYGRLAGPIDPRGKNVRPPTIAVGRLVEAPADIAAYIDWYVAEGSGGISITRAFASGYEFVKDLADAVTESLQLADVAVDELTATPSGAPWSAADLTAGLARSAAQGGAPGIPHQLVAPQGHYSANTLVPSDRGPKLRPTDPVISSGVLRGALWMTIGCHSGHDILDDDTPQGYVRRLSWAEALLRQGATLVGGTGYQYGESVLLKNSELLYTYLAQEIAASKATALGDALVAAKARYLAGCFETRGMDEKLVDVATLYGLPMLGVSVPSPIPPVEPPSAGDVPVPPAGSRAARTLTLDGYGPYEVRTDEGDLYYAAGDMLESIHRTLRPVLPAVFRVAAADDDAFLTGVLWLGGAYTENAPYEAVITRPATEETTPSPRYRNTAFLPARPFHIARGPGRQTFVFAPMQYHQPSRTVRLWRSGTFTLYYYSSRIDRGALHDAPAIRAHRLSASSGELVHVILEVRHYGGTGEMVAAYASYLDGAQLTTVALTGGVSTEDGIGFRRTFHGIIHGADPATLRVFFQVVGGNGRTSSLTNDGRLFPVSAAIGSRTTTLKLSAPVSTTYRERIRVTADVAGAGPRRPTGEVLFRLGGSRVRTALRNGHAEATLTVATRPIEGTYLVSASYLGSDRWAPSAKTKRLRVKPAPTRFETKGYADLVAGQRVRVAKLLLVSRGRPLGERPIRVTADDRLYCVATDPDGWLLLEPADIDADSANAPASLTIEFAEDGRYLGASATLKLTVRSRLRPVPGPRPSARALPPRRDR